MSEVNDEIWELAFALPNLRLPPPSDHDEVPFTPRFEAGDVALVPYEDGRVAALTARSKAARKLLEGFVDNFGKPVRVSVLIWRKAAPESINLEALTAFRNAVALSLLLCSWTSRGDHGRLYSDAFDFYPTTVGGNDRLVTYTAALRALFSEDAPFRGMPYAHISRADFGLWVDYYMHRALMHEWVERFQYGREDSQRRALFRSLEVAYMALSTPVKNQGSLTDWGVNVALWVSALEILAHPSARGGKGRVEQRVTLELLGEYTWKSESLNEARWPIELRRGKQVETRNVNAIQLAGRELYRARNSFLHGNPVDEKTLFPFENVAVSLIQAAPLVYRTALFAFLQTRVEPYRGFIDAEYDKSHPGHEHVMRMVGDDMTIESAAKDLFGIPSPTDGPENE